MVLYSNGKIYKIISNETNKIYIGSTCDKLCKRMADHRTKYKHDSAVSCKEILQYDDARIILVENYSCKNRDELNSREEHWIQEFKHICVNKRSAISNYKYRQKNINYLQKYNKKQWLCPYCCKKMVLNHKKRHFNTDLHKIIKQALTCKI